MAEVFYVHLPPEGDLPDFESVPTRVVLIAEAACSFGWQADVSAWLLELGCLYMLAWGEGCSSWDDSVDEANLAAFDFGDIPEDRGVMTTWHEREPLSEVFDFAKRYAHHSSVELQRTLLLHIANERRHNLYEVYADA